MNDELLNYLSHAGRPGMSWYKHKYGKWQKQARYANGQDDPNPQDITPSVNKAGIEELNKLKNGRVISEEYFDKIFERVKKNLRKSDVKHLSEHLKITNTDDHTLIIEPTNEYYEKLDQLIDSTLNTTGNNRFYYSFKSKNGEKAKAAMDTYAMVYQAFENSVQDYAKNIYIKTA